MNFTHLKDMPRGHSPAVRLTIAASGFVLLVGILGHPVLARVATTQASVNRGMPEDQVTAMHAVLKRPKPTAATEIDQISTTESDTFNTDQGPGPGPIGPGPGCNLFPAPASVGSSVPLSYFGPPPSTTNRSLVGPVQLLDTGQVDVAHGTITIPLYLGHMKGNAKNVWYILTDVDDSNVAAELGLNFSAKLTFAANGARIANFDTMEI